MLKPIDPPRRLSTRLFWTYPHQTLEDQPIAQNTFRSRPGLSLMSRNPLYAGGLDVPVIEAPVIVADNRQLGRMN